MRHYKWEGLNHVGLKTQGEIEAINTQSAKAELHKQGIFTQRIHQNRNLMMGKKITAHDISLFSRQMATMLHAGIPLIHSFDIVSKSLNNQRMKNLIAAIKKDVASGLTLAESLRQHRAFFNSLFCNLVDAGEKSGTLDTMLLKIATYKEKTDSIKKKIRKTLAYPMTVLLIACLVTTGLLIFVVPQFQSLFISFNAELPQLTRAVIRLSQFFQNEWYFIISTVGIGLSAFFYYKKHSIKFAHTLDKILLKLPIIGPIIENAAIARFTRTLSITFAAGLPLVEALKLVAGATGNVLFSNATDSIRNKVSSGQSMHLAMESTMQFPNMVIQMVAIGEESGTLEKMLNSVADYYEEAVDTSVDTLSSLIEPIIMAVLGLLVGGLVVAMYLPIFKLGSVV
jgi:type IV pilus assembly protein PilC